MRTAQIVLTLTMLMMTGRQALAAGWSPFSGSSSSTTVAQKQFKTAGDIAGTTSSSEEPGFFDRMSSGTRSFFSRMGRAMSGDKPKPKTKQVSDRRKSSTPKQGGFSSLFQPAEPDPPRTVEEWLNLERPKTP